MSAKMTVVEMLETLRGQMEFHRSQEEFHGHQEIHHREERARHATELAAVTQRFEALHAAVDAARQVLRVPETPPETAVRVPNDSDLGPRPKASQFFVRVLNDWPADAPFGAREFSAAVSRRSSGVKLRGSIDPRAVSLFLRRRLEKGHLEAVSEGRAYHEALYRKPDRNPE
jgi:hypothetical protein